MSNFGRAWLELALEVIEAAKAGETLLALERFQSLAPPQPGKGLRDRQRVLKTLLNSGLIREDSGFLALGERKLPDWLRVALIQGDVDGWRILQTIDPGGNAGRKFDGENLKAIGEIGEAAVVDFLKSSLEESKHWAIKHVSKTDDTAGYDIEAPALTDQELNRLEVKTSSRPTGTVFDFYLSVNEAKVGLRDGRWLLVAVQIRDGETEILGHVPMEILKQFLPTDTSKSSEWQSVLVHLDKKLLAPGLP